MPIGLVDASWGGKTIESFAPPTAMVRVRPATTKQYPSITRIPKYHPNNIAQSLTDHSQLQNDASCGMATGSAKSADAGHDEQTVSAEGTDKWEKWPDHWRWKGTPTVSFISISVFLFTSYGRFD